MSLLTRSILFFAMLCLAAAEAAAQPDSAPPAPDSAALELALPAPDSTAILLPNPEADTLAIQALAPPADSLVEPPKKRERRLELPQLVEPEEVTVDTSRRSRILPYTINHTSNDVQRLPLDTSLFRYRTDYPFLYTDVGAIFLGTLGSPALYYDFFKRGEGEEFLFLRPYEAYFFTPANTTFYNTTTPYTLLYYDWTSGSKSELEDQLRVLHAQNILHNLSFQISYNGLGAKGIYSRQRVDNRSAHFGLSFLGQYYKANVGYLFNEAELQENGGIADDRMITDSVVDPQQHLTNLAAAKNHLTSSSFYLTHSADVPMIYIGNDSVINNILIGRIGHSLEYSSYSKLYSDNNADTLYYLNRYLSAAETRDSIGLRKFENRLFLQLRPLRAYIFESLAGGIGYKNLQRYMFEPAMYLTGTSSETLSSVYVYASMSGWYKRYFQWNAYGQQNLGGNYQSGDSELRGSMRFSIFPIKEGLHLKLDARLINRSQDMFVDSYSTNHYRWSNSFGRTTETRLGATLAAPLLHINAGVSYAMTDGYVYFGDDAMPHQHSDPVNVLGATLNHSIAFGGLNLNHRMLFQISENDNVVSLPKFSLNADYYYELELVKNVLRGQLGVNVQYNTPFKGYAYNPSVGMFHTSSLTQGGYLWVDAFLAFRWKRATPFIKMEHVTQGLIEGNTAYFSAIHYPRSERVLKIGLSWKWFD